MNTKSLPGIIIKMSVWHYTAHGLNIAVFFEGERKKESNHAAPVPPDSTQSYGDTCFSYNRSTLSGEEGQYIHFELQRGQ